MYGYIKLGCERVLASLVALGQVVDVWFGGDAGKYQP